jgi:hypothetical protein
MNPTGPRFSASLTLAALVHLGIYWAITVSPAATANITGAADAHEIQLELDADARASTELRSTSDAARPTGQPPATTQRFLAFASSDGNSSTEHPGEASTLESEPTPEHAEPGVQNQEPALSRQQLGLDGNLLPLMSRAPNAAGSRADQAKAATARLQRSMMRDQVKRDSRLGLGAAGPVLSVLEKITRASRTPPDGSAIFSVVIDPSGKLHEIEVLEVHTDRQGWEGIGRAVARELEKKKLRVPKGTRGVRVTIEVVSQVQLPSGASPGLDVDVLGLPLKRSGYPKSKKMTLLDPTTGTILGLGFDPADIGANAKRNVRARVLDEQPL